MSRIRIAFNIPLKNVFAGPKVGRPQQLLGVRVQRVSGDSVRHPQGSHQQLGAGRARAGHGQSQAPREPLPLRARRGTRMGQQHQPGRRNYQRKSSATTEAQTATGTILIKSY